MNKKSLMVIAAHCDDIELNFAGTMLKYHEQFGYEIVYVQSTNNMSGGWSEATEGVSVGLSKLPEWITEKKSTVSEAYGRITHLVPWYYEIQQRKSEAANAARDCFNTVPIHLDYAQRHYTDRNLKVVDLRYGAPAPDCYDPAIPTIMTACDDPAQVERVAKLILEKNPEVILTHPAVDYTFEHTGTTLLVEKAFHKAQAAGYDGSFLCATVPYRNQMGGFYDRWDSFIDTTGFMEKKIDAIAKHACQIPRPDHLDLFDAFAGRMCGGCKSAETHTVVFLSETRVGPLTEEFKKNHAYCNTNWMQLFFSEETKKAREDFLEMCRNTEAIADKPVKKK